MQKIALERKETKKLIERRGGATDDQDDKKDEEEMAVEDEEDDKTTTKGAMIFGLVSLSVSALTYAFMNKQALL